MIGIEELGMMLMKVRTSDPANGDGFGVVSVNQSSSDNEGDLE